MEVFTIGHGSRRLEQFISLLTRSGIKRLVDVRRWPRSKTAHFNKEELEHALAKAGIAYTWMGESLGGYRSGGYERFMKSELFMEGLKRLASMASKERVCIMCLEISSKGCHRRFIASKLVELGFKVADIR